MKNVVIIGGGTAGWLTSLFIEKNWIGVNIILISSSNIGILGAGESSTTNFPGLLKELNIDEVDFIKKTKATIKIGNEYVNWRGDGKNMVHPFVGGPKSLHGFHFDAKLVADYFQNISLNRGVKHIDSEVIGFNQLDNGDVNEILLTDGTKVQSDFVFDCSGFARLVIGKLYNQEWISYNKYLNIDSAIAFFLPQNDNLNHESETTTKSIGMKCGWMWNAPLQHRWGCGYAFNSNYINDIDAKKEVEDYIGREITIVKKFNFNPGTYKNSWVNNCVAIGLSSSFLEPLEATSLLTSIMLLRKLKKFDFNPINKNEFNDYFNHLNEQNLLFIKYQYMCDRDDTKFWIDQKTVDVPENLLKLVNGKGELIVKSNDEIKSALNIIDDSRSLIFGFYSYNSMYKKNSKKFNNILI
jgi:tryptophan halogenase